MKGAVFMVALALTWGQAHAAKPCKELKSAIEAKLDKKGVKSYTLEVVPSGKAGATGVVGSCDAGANKIVYMKK